MEDLRKAFSDLKSACAAKKKSKKASDILALGATIEQLEDHLALLEEDNTSKDLFNRLSRQFRRPLVAAYTAVPAVSLRFAACLTSYLYEEKVLPEYTSGKLDQRRGWEDVLTALLSGVLDYHDTHGSADCKKAIGSALFAVLSSFSLSMTFMSTSLRCAVYNLLADVASGSKPNQEKLRELISGPKLGSHLWRTKDYLVQEALLNLFARMLPSVRKGASGCSPRMDFIQSVFVSAAPSPGCGDTGREIGEMLQQLRSSAWEPMSERIVRMMAASDITYPQPFKVHDFVACGMGYTSDTVYLDDSSFCTNLLVEEDQLESLEVSYATIRKIQVAFHGRLHANLSRVVMSLDTKPTIGGERSSDSGERTTHESVRFDLDRSEVMRFREVLESRNLTQLLALSSFPKTSLSQAPANLEIKISGGLVEKRERYDNVSQLYGTNDPSDDPSGEDHTSENVISANSRQTPPTPPTSVLNPRVSPEDQMKVLRPKSENAILIPKPTLSKGGVQVLQDVAFEEPGEDLSELEDIRSVALSSDHSRQVTGAAKLVVEATVGAQPSPQRGAKRGLRKISKLRGSAYFLPSSTSKNSHPLSESDKTKLRANNFCSNLESTSRATTSASRVALSSGPRIPDGPSACVPPRPAISHHAPPEELASPSASIASSPPLPVSPQPSVRRTSSKRKIKLDNQANRPRTRNMARVASSEELLKAHSEKDAEQHNPSNSHSSLAKRKREAATPAEPPKETVRKRARVAPLLPKETFVVDAGQCSSPLSRKTATKASTALAQPQVSRMASVRSLALEPRTEELVPMENPAPIEKEGRVTAARTRDLGTEGGDQHSGGHGTSQPKTHEPNVHAKARLGTSMGPEAANRVGVARQVANTEGLKGSWEVEPLRLSPHGGSPAILVLSEAGRQTEMIDLTLDDSPRQIRGSEHIVAPKQSQYEPASPARSSEDGLRRRPSGITTGLSVLGSRASILETTNFGELQMPHTTRGSMKEKREATPGRPLEPSIQMFADVLCRIDQAIVGKLAEKIQAVTADVETERIKVLSDASTDLYCTRADSIERFNSLITLESEYASFGRKAMHSLEDVTVLNTRACEGLKKVIQLQNHRFGKKPPKSLFSNLLPQSVGKFRG